MTSINTSDPEKKEYYIIARHILKADCFGRNDYECEDIHIVMPERAILLTYKEYTLLSNRLRRGGDEWVLMPVADPAVLDVHAMIEEQRTFEAEEAMKRAWAQKEREEAAAKIRERVAAKKAAETREKKLKALEKLKKELGVE